MNTYNDLLICFQKVIQMINGLSDIDKSRYQDQGNRYTKKGMKPLEVRGSFQQNRSFAYRKDR